MKLSKLFILLCLLTDSQSAEPKVESLVPGLSIKRLPVELANIDSMEYGQDGRLYAAGYDGRIHVLDDTDGDGLEDNATLFWNEQGSLLTPVGLLPTTEGVYVAARGRIALLKDTDGDGAADVNETVVSGWEKEMYNSNTRNDAAGVAIDRNGYLYFSLGCMSYNKAWLLDEDGNSRYDPTSERGAILKVSPDRKSREILCTGVRFIIGLDFNKHGDLFATDQEGDTWFPGGNPRDELLHIIPGRHYGFPFRHPKYLPDVIDEPAVVGFSPQHQSTCGFRINEKRANRKPFGPAHWEGNAIVTGFSRGKLWRVPLAKTRAGYVGKQVQFAAFESLPTDVAISPNGDLLVSCHSGKPDWGAGPSAEGYLYRIAFDRSTPQPVLAWPSGPMEVKIAFDGPVHPKPLGIPQIEMGEFAWEGDRYEWIWPGYEVVKAEKKAMRRSMQVSVVGISGDGRILTLTTAPHPWRARYRVVFPGIAAMEAPAETEPVTTEVSYDLGGVEASWTRAGADKASWSGWLPHVDSNVNRNLTQGSTVHEGLEELLKTPGLLRMNSQLLLPGKTVTFRFEGTQAFEVKSGENHTRSSKDGELHWAQLILGATEEASPSDARGGREQVLPTEVVPLQIEASTRENSEFHFDISYHADFDPYERPLRLEHLFVPWAPSIRPTRPEEQTMKEGEFVFGDPTKGRAIFFGAEANCASCHEFGGEGTAVAADLTVSIHRAPEAVLRDILQPNAAINPNYVSYHVELKNGQTLTGLVQSTTDTAILLIDAAAQTHQVRRSDIVDLRVSSNSLMPEGFEALGEEKLRDLVAFLCSQRE